MLLSKLINVEMILPLEFLTYLGCFSKPITQVECIGILNLITFDAMINSTSINNLGRNRLFCLTPAGHCSSLKEVKTIIQTEIVNCAK